MHIQFHITSNSNKQLDSLSREIVKAIKRSGAISAGPIPYKKGSRIIHSYNTTSKTLNLIMKIDEKDFKKVAVVVESLESPQ